MTEPAVPARPAVHAALPTTPLLLVTGKGGVGRSTVAAALAHQLAAGGSRVALVHPAGAPPAHLPPATPGLDIRPLKTQEAMDNYLNSTLPGPFAAAIRASRAFRLITAATPGLAELLTLGELKRLTVDEHYDHVVFDAPATGHLLALVDSPPRFARAAGAGPMARRADELAEWISDARTTSILGVTTGDPLAVSELMDLSERLTERLDRGLAAVIANRLAPASPSGAELKELAALSDSLPAGAADAIAAVAARARAEHTHVSRMAKDLGIPTLRVQEQPAAPVDAVAEQLATLIGARA